MVNWLISKIQSHDYTTQLGQSGRFLGRLLGPLLKTELSLIGNVFNH